MGQNCFKSNSEPTFTDARSFKNFRDKKLGISM